MTENEIVNKQPEQRHTLIPGLTVREWASIMKSMLLLGGLFVLAGIGVGFANSWGPGTMPALPILSVTGLVLIYGVQVVVKYVNRRERLEMEAGYTTAPGRHDEFDLVDSRTGLILRRANEPLFTGDEWKAADQRAAQYLVDHPDSKQTFFQRGKRR